MCRALFTRFRASISGPRLAIAAVLIVGTIGAGMMRPMPVVAAQRFILLDAEGHPMLEIRTGHDRAVRLICLDVKGETLFEAVYDERRQVFEASDAEGARLIRLDGRDLAAIAALPAATRAQAALIDRLRGEGQAMLLRFDDADRRIAAIERRASAPDPARRQDEIIRELQQALRQQDSELRALRSDVARSRRDLDALEWRVRDRLPR
jgi:hypothetical protein